MLPALQRLAKYLLSYRKTDWELQDYPLRVRHQAGATSGGDPGNTVRPIPWLVQILGWEQMPGAGDTQEAAYADLAHKLTAYKQQGNRLPRPGTRVPLKFAASSEVGRYEQIATEFFSRILDMDYQRVFISDESSLEDFALSDERSAELRGKIAAVYGIDISDIADGNLVRIFARIRERTDHPD
jgi:hypothetical protein